MSEKQHLSDEEKIDKHKVAGESCLNRHQGDYKDGDTCSYRWQGRERALADARVYNWPAYKSLTDRGTDVKTAGRMVKGKPVPSWYDTKLPAPQQGDWNLKTGTNFTDKCYTPYWHESHHIVPNGALRTAIEIVGKGNPQPSKVIQAIRTGLLKENYNLNNKKNMILLPMDHEVAMALGLPKHRKTPSLWFHKAYSDYVETKVKAIFTSTKVKLVKHKVQVTYKPAKRRLENLAARLYDGIKAAGRTMRREKSKRDALDDMSKKELNTRRRR
jgi:hypothetical protein